MTRRNDDEIRNQKNNCSPNSATNYLCDLDLIEECQIYGLQASKIPTNQS